MSPSEELSALQREIAGLRATVYDDTATRAELLRFHTAHEELATLTSDWECERCHCTNERACPGGCSWVDVNLCSACAQSETGERKPEDGGPRR